MGHHEGLGLLLAAIACCACRATEATAALAPAGVGGSEAPATQGPADAQPDGEAGAVGAKFEPASARGVVRLLLFDSPDTFLLAPVQAVGEPAALRELWIEAVAPGRYALMVHHDEDGDGNLDRNFLGIPTEPIGFSNGYRPSARPLFERAAFDLGSGERREFAVALDRPLGELGQIGVGAAAVVWRGPYAGDAGVTTRAFPAVTYIGRRLQVLGPEIRYGLTSQPFFGGDLRVAATARFRFGVYEEDDSRALDGLGDREDTLMMGVSLASDLPGGFSWSAGYERDALGEIGGGGASVQVARSFELGSTRLTPFVGLNWLESELAGHDYGVSAAGAQPGRPAYDPGDTLGVAAGIGWFVELSERWTLVGNASVELLDKDIRESPIVSEDELIRGFLSLIYAF